MSSENEIGLQYYSHQRLMTTTSMLQLSQCSRTLIMTGFCQVKRSLLANN